MRDHSAKTRSLLRDAIPVLASDTERTVATKQKDGQQWTAMHAGIMMIASYI